MLRMLYHIRSSFTRQAWLMRSLGFGIPFLKHSVLRHVHLLLLYNTHHWLLQRAS